MAVILAKIHSLRFCADQLLHQQRSRKPVTGGCSQPIPGQLGTGVQLNAVKTIPRESFQKPPQTITTNYSMAVDLKAGLIHLYLKTIFVRKLYSI